jgi:hypothetical protein
MVLKKRIHEILEVEHPDDSVSRLFQSGILSLIALNVIALILDSEPTFQRATPVFAAFELLSVSIFSVE